MEKIKFIADTACDIPDDDLREYAIDMPSVPIVVDGEEYFERRSFGIRDFYSILMAANEIPVTSRVPLNDFLSCYKRAFGEGYTSVVCVTINAGASGTNASAQMAREHFYKECPGAEEAMPIYIVDSRTYSLAYGHPVVQAAKKAREGMSVKDVLAYLEDYFARVEIYLGCYTLEYAKKSGRISAAAAFVGDILGLRPIISMIDGETKVVEKIRGEKNLVGRIADICKQPGVNMTEDVVVVCAAVEEYGKELQAKLKKEFGVDAPIYFAGASIAINAGPKMVAVTYLGKKRPQAAPTIL